MWNVQRVVLSLRTARYLRLRQLLAFGRRLLRRPKVETAVIGWNPERAAIVTGALHSLGPVDDILAVRKRAMAWRDGYVEMLGRRRAIPTTWLEEAPSALWAYHLHYHDSLAELAWISAQDRNSALAREIGFTLGAWFEKWGSGGAPAWDPYPLSVRSINWLRILGSGQMDAVSRENVKTVLPSQLATLRHDLEWHLEANHLLRNAWALAIAPWCLSDPQGSTWGKEGAALYWQLLLEQVPEDGVHEERTPMYHARVLRDALEVIAVHDALGLAIPEKCRDRVASMTTAMSWLQHPNGALRLINDSAGDHGVDLARVQEISAALLGTVNRRPHGRWHPRDARFVAIHDSDYADALFVDIGGPAPAHQPGHAHAGALSIEIDIDGHPLIVDSGCSGYDGDEWRTYLRGTSAHNTVSIDGLDQSEMWATFRIARRAIVNAEQIVDGEGEFRVYATCRPYHRHSATHHRSIARRSRQITIEDRVEGADDCRVNGFLHFDSGWDVEPMPQSVVAHKGSSRVTVAIEGGVTWALCRGELSPRCGWRSPAFGEVIPTWTLNIASPAGEKHRWRVIITPG